MSFYLKKKRFSRMSKELNGAGVSLLRLLRQLTFYNSHFKYRQPVPLSIICHLKGCFYPKAAQHIIAWLFLSGSHIHTRHGAGVMLYLGNCTATRVCLFFYRKIMSNLWTPGNEMSEDEKVEGDVDSGIYAIWNVLYIEGWFWFIKTWILFCSYGQHFH